jgi:hypothetical protein
MVICDRPELACSPAEFVWEWTARFDNLAHSARCQFRQDSEVHTSGRFRVRYRRCSEDVRKKLRRSPEANPIRNHEALENSVELDGKASRS